MRCRFPISNSPAIDAGVSLTNLAMDYAGVSRPLDGRNDGTNAWDVGAYESVHPQADSDGAWAAVAGTTNLTGTNGWMAFTNPVPAMYRHIRLRALRP